MPKQPANRQGRQSYASSTSSGPNECPSGSDSDSDDHDGFVKVSNWKPPSAEHTQLVFKPTISQTVKAVTSNKSPTATISPLSQQTPQLSSQSSSQTSPSAIAQTPIASSIGSHLMDRVRSTFKAVVNTGTATSLQPSNLAPGVAGNKGTDDPTSDNDSSSSSSSGNSSCSDEEISDVLDETEIQLIEAMEDSQVSSAPSAKSGKSATAPDTTLHPLQLSNIAAAASTSLSSTSSSGSSILSTSPRKGLSWV
ncbi:hypothetical protein FB639_003968, partial [Coemansia asiatica]